MAVALTKSLDDARHSQLMRRATWAAMCVAIALCIAKAIVWLATDSVAMLGSALDSGLDIVATGFNFVAVRHALQPPDREHRFGHGKAEAISGLAQSAFIAGSALFLIVQSLGRIFHPHEVDFTLAGVIVTVAALIITGALVIFQRMVKHETRSLAIAADELHYRGDLILNGAVLIALVLSGPAFGWTLADPIIGAAIACYIAYNASSIVRSSYDQLMDREFNDAEREQIKSLVRQHPEVVAMHDLRTRRSGRDAFIQLHLELEPNLPLVDAHRISDDVEERIHQAFPHSEVLIHEDPAGFEVPHTPIPKPAAAR